MLFTEVHIVGNRFKDKLTEFCNFDHDRQKEFFFKLFDTLGEGKLSEQGMFVFQQITSFSLVKTNMNELLGLHQFDSDVFMRYFNEDYLKVIKELRTKAGNRALALKNESKRAPTSKASKLLLKDAKQTGQKSTLSHFSDEEEEEKESLLINQQKSAMLKMMQNIMKSHPKSFREQPIMTFGLDREIITLKEFDTIEWPYAERHPFLYDLIQHLTNLNLSQDQKTAVEQSGCATEEMMPLTLPHQFED